MRPLIAGNWKMHGMGLQLQQIEAHAASLKAVPPRAKVLICSPSTLIERMARDARGRIGAGGQNCHLAKAGNVTVDLSAEMLKDAGASAVRHIVIGLHGHPWLVHRLTFAVSTATCMCATTRKKAP